MILENTIHNNSNYGWTLLCLKVRGITAAADSSSSSAAFVDASSSQSKRGVTLLLATCCWSKTTWIGVGWVLLRWRACFLTWGHADKRILTGHFTMWEAKERSLGQVPKQWGQQGMVRVSCGVVRLCRVLHTGGDGLVWATNYEGQGDHVYSQMTSTCIQMSSLWNLQSVTMTSGLLPCWIIWKSYNTCVSDEYHL